MARSRYSRVSLVASVSPAESTGITSALQEASARPKDTAPGAFAVTRSSGTLELKWMSSSTAIVPWSFALILNEGTRPLFWLVSSAD